MREVYMAFGEENHCIICPGRPVEERTRPETPNPLSMQDV